MCHQTPLPLRQLSFFTAVGGRVCLFGGGGKISWGGLWGVQIFFKGPREREQKFPSPAYWKGSGFYDPPPHIGRGLNFTTPLPYPNYHLVVAFLLVAINDCAFRCKLSWHFVWSGGRKTDGSFPSKNDSFLKRHKSWPLGEDDNDLLI